MENHHLEHEQLYLHNGHGAVQEHESSIPPGYRFVPDDVQLIDDYLKVIVEHPELGGVNGLIFTVNLYGSSPDELTAVHKEQCENNWYFFTKRIRKYANGNRPDRAAGDGFWKQTNVVGHIFRAGENNKRFKIGRKITLDYLCKREGQDQDGSRSDWKMTEYRLDGANLPENHNSHQFDEWCLCRLYKSKSAKKTREDDLQANLIVEAKADADADADAELIAPQKHNGQEPNSGALLIAPQEHNEHVAGELHNNFSGQRTAAPFSNQNIIAQHYNGWNAGPSNHAVWNLNNSNHVETATSSSMNRFHYYTDALNGHQDIYPLNATGYVQPLRSLPPNGFPTSSDYNTNQSSAENPTSSDYNTNQSSSDILDNNVTSEWEFDYPSDIDMDFRFDDFDL